MLQFSSTAAGCSREKNMREVIDDELLDPSAKSVLTARLSQGNAWRSAADAISRLPTKMLSRLPLVSSWWVSAGDTTTNPCVHRTCAGSLAKEELWECGGSSVMQLAVKQDQA